MTVVPGPDGEAQVDDSPRTAGRATRVFLIAAVGLLALAALSSFLPGGGGQGGGSPSSSYSNRPDGVSAWAELLGRFGRRVERLRGDLDAAPLDPASTVVVLDAPGLSDHEAEALGEFVRSGGYLLAGGAGADGWLHVVVDGAPTLVEKGPRTASPVGAPPAPELEDVRTVRTAQLGSWRQPGTLDPILAGEGGRMVAVAGNLGRGRVVALADPSPLQNGLLAAEDNAALGLGLAGSHIRPVFFAEGVHGYGEGEGLAALPRRWRLTLSGLGLAAGIWLVARSRRLGPPEAEARRLPPPRWAYVEAVTATLVRTRRAHEAAEPVRHQARQLIARRAGLPPDAGPDDLYQAAVRLGLPAEEAAAALGGGPPDDAGIMAAGRALARLSGGEQ